MLFNLSAEEERRLRQYYRSEISNLRLRWTDFVRAFLTVAVFLAFVAGDLGIQKSFFPHAEADPKAKQVFKIAPLAVAVFSSIMFTLFPNARKGMDLLSGTVVVPQRQSPSVDHV